MVNSGELIDLKNPLDRSQNTRTGSHGPVEIVRFPINGMVIFHSYVSLPEGKCLVNSLEPICLVNDNILLIGSGK